jgi:SAM-dependent methyltransferase
MVDTQSIFAPERAKYEHLWRDVPAYRNVSFGEMLVGPFLAITGARPGQSLVDVGCGPGRAALKFAALGLDVAAVDLSAIALDAEVSAAVTAGHITFVDACVWRDWAPADAFDFAYCCDVLEHIPVEFTMLVVARCISAARRSFFHVNFDPDHFGQTIGAPLHLTVQPFTWWRDRLGELGVLTDARDMLGHGIFLLERRHGDD